MSKKQIFDNFMDDARRFKIDTSTNLNELNTLSDQNLAKIIDMKKIVDIIIIEWERY